MTTYCDAIKAPPSVALYLDAHRHLPAASDGDELRQSLGDADLGRLGLNSTCEADWPTILALAAQHPKIRPFLGIHPWWAAAADSDWEARLQTLLATSTAAIGEIGLDALATAPAKVQEDIFCRQLAMAADLGRPVAIHCCRRWGRLLDLLASGSQRARPIIHGFTGSLEVMHRLVDLGAMLSFGPSLLQPARAKVRAACQQAPLDRLLLESDWPPGRQANEQTTATAVLGRVYQVAAELRGLDLAQFRHIIWQNGQILTP